MIADFIGSTAGLAVKGALIAAFLDFAFGVFAAIKDGTFAIDALAAFVRKHLAGRVFPLSLLAFAAFYTNDPFMTAAAAGGLTAYAAETLGSIYGSVSPPSPTEVASRDASAATNPIPPE